MSYGFSAINTSGQTIISDEMENLHFYGKATLNGNDGGDYGDFPGYSGANDTLDGRIIFTYSLVLEPPTGGGGIFVPASPLVFIKPTDYTRWHALLTQSVAADGKTWTFDVIASGLSQSNPPELFCFVNANSTSGATSDHGLIVWKADGYTRTFDSRYRPLAVTAGGSIAPATCPSDDGCPGVSTGHPWNYATLDHDFRSSSQYNSQATNGATYTNLMFSAPSLAQAVYKRQVEGYKYSSSSWGGGQSHWSTAIWWVMYRNTFRIRNGYFDAGWTDYAAGYSFSSNHEGGGWFGGGGGGYSSGTMPYSAKVINQGSNAFMIADSTGFD